MEDLSLHILDIAENAIAAGAQNITIYLEENEANNLLILQLRDDGKGMDEDTRRKSLDPFFTTKQEKKIGLGLPLLAQACREVEGSLEIDSEPGKGTTVTARMKLNHIDRKPLGDIGSTVMTLISGNPKINIKFRYKHNEQNFELDTRDIKSQFGEEALSLPEVLISIRDNINKATVNLPH